jgi:uncharacterized membrane protein YccC
LNLAQIWPGPAAWRQATRMLIALACAYLLTSTLHLHSGYWAMITVAVVVQGNLAGTLDAGISQLAGTVVGGLLGMAGVLARTHHLAPDWLVLVAILSPLALLSATDAHLRTGPVTALIVLLVTPATGSSIDLAMGRIGEIAIGSAIGIVVSILIFPARAQDVLRRDVATALRGLGRLAEAQLTAAADDALLEPVDAAIAQAEADCAAWRRERAIRLAAPLQVDPLLRTLRRLRTDVVILGRAVGPDDADPAVASQLHDWFAQAADGMQTGIAPPDLGAINAASTAPAALGFALDVLRRDIAEMCDRIAEYRQIKG